MKARLLAAKALTGNGGYVASEMAEVARSAGERELLALPGRLVGGTWTLLLVHTRPALTLEPRTLRTARELLAIAELIGDAPGDTLLREALELLDRAERRIETRGIAKPAREFLAITEAASLGRDFAVTDALLLYDRAERTALNRLRTQRARELLQLTEALALEKPNAISEALSLLDRAALTRMGRTVTRSARELLALAETIASQRSALVLPVTVEALSLLDRAALTRQAKPTPSKTAREYLAAGEAVALEVTRMGPPAAPAWITAYGFPEGAIEIRWNSNSTSEEGFFLYRDGVYRTTLPPGETLYIDFGTPGEPTYYAVSAYNAYGESARIETIVYWE